MTNVIFRGSSENRGNLSRGSADLGHFFGGLKIFPPQALISTGSYGALHLYEAVFVYTIKQVSDQKNFF